ncbi:MAG: PHP domain-containing protein [Hamadaea sp.]|uniref:PHP domain-containing protein n=1 Tax=Hamadaea sp. TaxID=2024425 RepID=UPI0017E33596|nr:PHP domain-containing protein [Hamadaea sp.]NUR70902.1 PHP domain-containing protein [Hamadaea sp.]NUT21689.1 PHP domain-containing protein [Hamadaea sp.]
MLPTDGHVHSEWSWDAFSGDMEQTCAQAVALGLPAIAFTEHVDHTKWTVDPGELDPFPTLKKHLDADDRVVPPRFDASGYLECLDRCRVRFPDLRIISGVELGEPHRHRDQVAALLSVGEFERVLGSLHTIGWEDKASEPPFHFRRRPAVEVMRDYLAELPRMFAEAPEFGVLAHVDYAVRYWPADAEPFDPYALQPEFRHVLRTLAASGRVLEVNTKGPMRPEIVRWWHEEGGEAVCFGSDAHEPTALAFRFAEAAAMVEAHGFRPGRHPYEFWVR